MGASIMSDETATTGGIIGVLTAAFGGILWQQRSQCATLQTSLNDANKALEEERASCGERMSLLEARLDKERDDCDRRHRELRADIDKLRERVRSITPRDFPAPKLDRPSGEHPTFGKLDDDA